MGLLKTLGFGNREGGSVESPAVAPKAEAKEEKSATETGRERLNKIVASMKEMWKEYAPKAKNVGKWLAEKFVSLGFATVGVAEKGIKMSGKGYEQAVGYGKETLKESGEGLNKTIDNLADWGKNQIFEHQKRQTENQLKREARKEAWEATKKELLQKMSDTWTATKEFAKTDWRQTRADVDRNKEKFLNWTNETRMKLTGTAELKGEIKELKDAIQRQNRLIEQLLRLQGVQAETPVVEADDDQDEGTINEVGA